MDKAARAALLTAKGMDKTSENIADYVADLLRQGRAKEITDDLMAQADPQRLHHHYTTGNTGMDLPMDQASRMARAAAMGYANKEYRGVTDPLGSDRVAPRKRYDGKNGNQIGFWTSNNPYVASAYAHPRYGSVYPFLTKEPHGGFPEIDVKGNDWSNIPKDFAIKKGGKDIPLTEYNPIPWDEYASDHIASGAEKQGDLGVKFKNMVDPGGYDYVGEANTPSDITARIDTSGIRSQFARFDPRLDHLAHLSASTGGAMDFARHVEAVQRAGGQIAPSKYLPNVPRQVHAGGGRENGRAAFLSGNHPDVPNVVYHGTTSDVKSFDRSKIGQSALGFHFGNKETAGSLANTRPDGSVMPVHLSLKNPIRLQDYGDWLPENLVSQLSDMGKISRKEAEKLYNSYSEDGNSEKSNQHFIGVLKKLGHDGIVYLNRYEGITKENYDKTEDYLHEMSDEEFKEAAPEASDSFIAFHPHQIKSAIGNQGTFDPNDPDITKADGGRIHAEDGGKMELRSRAAEAIRNQPQLKGNVNQLLAVAAKGKGVKQAELANAGQPSGNIISKEELAKHFEDALPKVQVKKLKNKEPDPLSSSEMAEYRRLEADPFGYGQDGYDRLQELEDRQRGEIKARYQQYTLPQGENYREHLLHLPAEHGPNSWTNFRSSHWETPNVIAHLRMKDRDNGKTLHVEEVQSDWGQEGRERGFYDIAKPFHVFDTKTGQTVHEASTADEAEAVADKLGPQYDYQSQHDDMPPKGPYVGNTQQWTDLALKHALTEAAKGGHDRVVFSPGQANADMYGQRNPITEADLVSDPNYPDILGHLHTYDSASRKQNAPIKVENETHLAKILGKEHARDILAEPLSNLSSSGMKSQFISGPNMAIGGHGMVDYYNNIVHPSALKLLQQHDPSIKPESYDLPNGYKGFGLPMTDTARQSILKNGFGAFKRGGTVGKEEGGSVTDTEDFRNWFGNSPTHTDGDPHVLYTGTSKDKDFTSFNVGRHGTWFTRDPALASQYAEQNDSQGYKQDGWKLTPINTASRVIPAYVRAENPYTGDLPDEVLRDNYKKAQSDWFDTLRRKGHDAWIPARHNGDLVVALKEPQQIKSIFNNGKFDPNQKHMNKAGGGTVGKEEGGATGSLREKALWPSAQAIKAGTGSREAHAELVNKIKPVSPYAAPVPPASDQQVHDALTKDKQPKAFAPRALEEGTPVAVRLDIPAYEKRNTWVVSVHHPKSDFTAGEVIGYDSVAHIGNPRFGVHPTGALNIASGKPKATIATVHGNWKKTTPEDAFKLSQTVHNDPQWRQVGMDPERHSYFYDRETQEPVMAADEALHIGPLVYAKNPVYGKKTDFAFSSGGDVSAALALTRRFTKDGKAATMALKPKGK